MSSDEGALPLVTAVVVCYNHARFVVEALESVKGQAYPNLHLVVLDDFSKDNSVEVIRRWLDQFWPDAVFVAHGRNMGLCRTVNDALARAKGKYIRFLAADDRWVSNSLLRQVEVMEAAPEDVGLLYSDAYQMDESGELLPKTLIGTGPSFEVMPEGWTFDTLLERNFVPALTALVRRRCFDVVGGYDEDLIFEDWDMWLRISRQFKFKYFPEPTAYYRLLQTSMTNTLSAEMEESTRRIYLKCLRRGWLTGQTKKSVIFLEYRKACRAYRRGFPCRVGDAAWVFRHRPCIKHALLLLAVFVGLPYGYFEHLINAMANLNQRARRLLAREQSDFGRR